jgi:SAM-dependent methyltransferase
MKTLNAEKWDKAARAYSQMVSSHERDAYEYFVNIPSILQLLPKEAHTICDLGCGSGEFTELLKKHYEEKYSNEVEIIGGDVSPQMLEIARQQFPEIEFQLVDLELPFADRFKNKSDLVVMRLVLMFVDNLDNAAAEVSKLIPEKGHLLISVTHPVNWFYYYVQNKFGIKTRAEFRALQEGYFSETHLWREITGDKELKFGYINRKFSTYVNTFAKYGLLLEKVEEPQPGEEFKEVAGEKEFNDKKDFPARLNLLFQKH